MTIRIGLPRGLLHYQYGSLWEGFLCELGADVVTTGETTKATLNLGSSLDEVCLPSKVYFGHAYTLASQVDYLFTPRIISVAAGEYTCPKIIGMPDMLKSNIDQLPPLIDISINLRKSIRSLFSAICQAGHLLGKSTAASMYAWYHAWRRWHNQPHLPIAYSHLPRVGLIGHPYILYDRQISMNVIDRLKSSNVDVVTPAMLDHRITTAAARKLGKKIFWSNSAHMAGAALALMEPPRPIEGMIFLTSFSCGPDALIGELISRRAKACGIPCMLLTVDEHTAEAGFVTRLEAFTDMLTRRG